MAGRAEKKRRSRERIVAAAARRMREEGLSGASVGDVMSDTGLTHGGFYGYFRDKAELFEQALGHALTTGRAAWVEGLEDTAGRAFAAELAARYLNDRHRCDRGRGCAFAAVGGEIPRSDGPVRDRYEAELRRSISVIAAGLGRGTAGPAPADTGPADSASADAGRVERAAADTASVGSVSAGPLSDGAASAGASSLAAAPIPAASASPASARPVTADGAPAGPGATGGAHAGPLGDDTATDAAMAFLALCIGGIQMARAVRDEELADRILAVCRRAATEIGTLDGTREEPRR